MAAKLVIGVVGAGALALALLGCSEEKVVAKDISLCQKIVKASLDMPEGFKVIDESSEETSEGMSVTVQVEYKDASGAAMEATERCWFDALKGDAVTKLYVEKDGEMERVPDEDLAQYLKQVSG